MGQRLREARLLAGTSQDKIGAGIGVSFQAAQKYESGNNRISASRLLKAAQLLDRPVSFFFEDLGGAATNSGACGFSREQIGLVRHYQQIPDDKLREHVLQMTKKIGNPRGVGSNTKPARRR